MKKLSKYLLIFALLTRPIALSSSDKSVHSRNLGCCPTRWCVEVGVRDEGLVRLWDWNRTVYWVDWDGNIVADKDWTPVRAKACIEQMLTDPHNYQATEKVCSLQEGKKP